MQEFEASLAPREGDMLSLPFDQYGRMRIVQNVLNSLYTAIERDSVSAQSGSGQPAAISVLDVGGYPGVLRHFLSSDYYDVSVLDVAPDDGSIPNYTQGSGLELPFANAGYDVVTALDTLEHIPQPDRERFLDEMMRTARHAAVLINPVQSVEADVAEETLDEYIQWILDARQEQLKEHREYGLPDLEATVEAFRRRGWRTLHFPAANVYNWLLMMLAKHYLLSLRDERAAGFERTLDRFYNLTFSEADRSQPAYRGVLVAVRPGLEEALHLIQGDYPPMPASDNANTVRLQLAQTLMSLFNLETANHEDRLLREQIEHKDKHAASLEQRLAVIDVQLDRARHDLRQVPELQKAVADLQQVILEQQGSLEAGSRRIDDLEQALDDKDRHIGNLQQALDDKDRHISNLQGDLANKDQHVSNLTSRLEQEVKAKNEHIVYLENLLQGIESGRVLRMTRKVARLLGRG